MRTAKIQIMIWFFLVIATLAVYRFISAEKTPHEVQEASKGVELEKIAIQKEHLRRNDALVFYGEISTLSVFLFCALMVSYAYKKKLSIHILELRGAKIPMREKDLPKALPVAYDLALAEKMEQTFPEKAFALYEKMTAIRLQELDALTLRGRVTTQAALPEHAEAIDDRPMRTPAFREMLSNGAFVEGGDLICGFDTQNEPQTRSMDDLKAISVTGWQGSGKTLSMAYLTACSLIQCPGSFAYILDPHDKHKEGLGNILRPLEKTGRVKVVSKFEISGVIAHLDKILDDRLEGRASSGNRIILVIDELARLSGLPCFDTILSFVERCTNEIRKANILFVAGSTKWTARHFKGRADIRASMPSYLIHHTKLSQAELILEKPDKHEKELFKQVDKPGKALLGTSSRVDPSLINVPLITPADIYQVAELLMAANDKNGNSQDISQVDDPGFCHQKNAVSSEVSCQVSENETPKSELCLKSETPLKTRETPDRTLIAEYLLKHGISREEMANILGVSVSMVKEVLAGRKKLTSERKHMLENYKSEVKYEDADV